jgi:hypothetical protein
VLDGERFKVYNDAYGPSGGRRDVARDAADGLRRSTVRAMLCWLLAAMSSGSLLPGADESPARRIVRRAAERVQMVRQSVGVSWDASCAVR